MKTILKAYKFRIYPSNSQIDYLNQVFGDVRFVWNQLVANFNNYNTPDFKEKFNEKYIKEEHSFLKDSISYALQQKRIDFDSTKTQFFNKKRKKALGRIKFKKKGVSNDSFRLPAQALTNPLLFNENKIKLTKLGKVKCKFDRQPKGTLKSVTVSKTKSNKFFVSCLVEEEISRKPKTGNAVGIDLGLKELLTLSNGDVINNPRWFKESQFKLAMAQKHLSRKTKGSNRYNKQKLKVAKLHEQISNQRSWYTHNVTNAIVDQFDIICLEDLNIQGMSKNHKLAKSINDASLSEIVRQLEYKAEWYGKTVIKVDRFYPSSKTCSSCGNIKHDLKLSDRVYVCNECNTKIDRDLNASINILNNGITVNSVEATDYSRGEEIRLEECLHSNIASSMKRLENY